MSIENTARRDPLVHLMGAMSDGMSGYIEDMEAAGQRQLVSSDTLPVEAPWDELEALGFVPSEPVPGDNLFRRCALPEGWKREGSSHAMWSHVVDERGVQRVAVFYKAAFYDRSAFARIIKPGAADVMEAVYGDGPAVLPKHWGVLTEEERQDFRGGLERYLQEQAEYPSSQDRTPRVRELLQLAAA